MPADAKAAAKFFAAIADARKPIVSALVHENPDIISARHAVDGGAATPCVAFQDDAVISLAESFLGLDTTGMDGIQLALMVLHNNCDDDDDSLDHVRRDILYYLLENYPLEALDMHRWGKNNTLIHLASVHGDEEMVTRLLRRGASPMITNDKGFNAVDVALNDATVKIFRAHMARKVSESPRKYMRRSNESIQQKRDVKPPQVGSEPVIAAPVTPKAAKNTATRLKVAQMFDLSKLDTLVNESPAKPQHQRPSLDGVFPVADSAAPKVDTINQLQTRSCVKSSPFLSSSSRSSGSSPVKKDDADVSKVVSASPTSMVAALGMLSFTDAPRLADTLKQNEGTILRGVRDNISKNTFFQTGRIAAEKIGGGDEDAPAADKTVGALLGISNFTLAEPAQPVTVEQPHVTPKIEPKDSGFIGESRREEEESAPAPQPQPAVEQKPILTEMLAKRGDKSKFEYASSLRLPSLSAIQKSPLLSDISFLGNISFMTAGEKVPASSSQEDLTKIVADDDKEKKQAVVAEPVAPEVSDKVEEPQAPQVVVTRAPSTEMVPAGGANLRRNQTIGGGTIRRKQVQFGSAWKGDLESTKIVNLKAPVNQRAPNDKDGMVYMRIIRLGELRMVPPKEMGSVICLIRSGVYSTFTNSQELNIMTMCTEFDDEFALHLNKNAKISIDFNFHMRRAGASSSGGGSIGLGFHRNGGGSSNERLPTSGPSAGGLARGRTLGGGAMNLFKRGKNTELHTSPSVTSIASVQSNMSTMSSASIFGKNKTPKLKDGTFGRAEISRAVVVSSSSSQPTKLRFPVSFARDEKHKKNGMASLRGGIKGFLNIGAGADGKPAPEIGEVEVELFYLPSLPGVDESMMPQSLSEIEQWLNNKEWHKQQRMTGMLSQKGGDLKSWRLRYFTLIGAKLQPHHEMTREPRQPIDLNNCTFLTTKSAGFPHLRSVAIQQHHLQPDATITNSCYTEEEEFNSLDIPHSFRLHFKDGDKIDFYADNEETLVEWVNVLEGVLKELPAYRIPAWWDAWKSVCGEA